MVSEIPNLGVDIAKQEPIGKKIFRCGLFIWKEMRFEKGKGQAGWLSNKNGKIKKE